MTGPPLGSPRITLRRPHILTVGGRRALVSPSLVSVLFALMAREENSNGQLVEAVWPGGTIRPLGTYRSIGNYIHQLRRALKGHWRIVNRFGWGWRLERDE